MQQKEEGKKGSVLNKKEEPQEAGEKALNVLLMGTSGAGKSSLVNYLLGSGGSQAAVGHSGISCTKDSLFFDVTLENRKLRIYDTQGFNDTNGFTDGNGNVASRIRF